MSAADYKAQVKILADVLADSPLDLPCNLLWRPSGWCKDHCKDGQDSPDVECWMRYAMVMTENKTKSDEKVDQIREDAKMTGFKPGDKFILELGAERKMFDEFEIAGTDLYVKISLLEKPTRYESEKFEIHNDHTDCIWYHYLDDDDDVPNACPSTCSQYRDGWNDAMKYIYCDGKGYQPYTRKAK